MSAARQNLQLLTLATLLSACLGPLPEGSDADTDEVDPADPLAELSTKQQITYVVIPHPDDEYEAWSLVEKSPGNYPVFVLLTRGEQSGYCNPGGEAAFQPEYGEHVAGHPWTGRWTPGCSTERVDSFHRFLDGMAERDADLPRAPSFVGTFSPAGRTLDGQAPKRHDWDGANGNPTPYVSRTVDVWANAKGARVVFDLGDGDLSKAEVIWAIETVRANKAAWGFPDLPDYAHIGAAFYNADYADCDLYAHPDHRAIHEALWEHRFGASHQWARTCQTDPDVTATGGRVKAVSRATHDHAFAATTTTRTGQHTIHYGWLDNAWYQGCESECGFSRVQAFWRRPGT